MSTLLPAKEWTPPTGMSGIVYTLIAIPYSKEKRGRGTSISGEMPPTWRVRADGLAEYIPTCKMVIGSCITELVSLFDQKAHSGIGKNNANLAKANAPADSIGYKRVISGWRLGTMADLHPECRIFRRE
jgi:hypothetical protein